MVDKIIKKYKDKYGFIYKLDDLVLELIHNKFSNDKILSIITDIEENNKKILCNLKQENKVNEIKNKNISSIISIEKNYNKKGIIDKEKKCEEIKNNNVQFYIDLIDEDINSVYLFLPKSKDKEAINIIDLVIINYIKDFNFYRNYLSICNNFEESNNVNKELSIILNKINLLKKYKEELLLETQDEINDNKNIVTFFVNSKNIPYIFTDVDKESYKYVFNLIDSIINGTFKNIKTFTNNDSLKGTYEVRDLFNKTRVFFVMDNNEYCIFYAIDDKSETNSIYHKKLMNRYKIFKENKKSIDKDDYKILIKNRGIYEK